MQPRPGTDIALMLAVMHVLIRDGLIDEQWVAAHTIGYDEFATHVAEWTPDGRPPPRGIDVGDIETLAQITARSAPL